MFVLKNSVEGALLHAELGCRLLLSLAAISSGAQLYAGVGEESVRSFPATGAVREIHLADRTIVIAHEAITNYMGAMTMPFNVKRSAELDGLQPGDQISFQLHVTDSASWIDGISKIGKRTESAHQAEPNRAAL